MNIGIWAVILWLVWLVMVFAAEHQLADTVFYSAELLSEDLLMWQDMC